MKNKIETIRRRMDEAAFACGRDPKSVRLVAVSKTYPASAVEEAIGAGATVFGENYIQESIEKVAALKEAQISWHFIGHLQSNKAKYAVKLFDLIHSVDSLKLAAAIGKEAKKIGKVQEILVQVNIGQEASKSGAAIEEAEALVSDIAGIENLSVKGLMGMPPFFGEPEKARPYFRTLREISDRIKEKGVPGVTMAELSMGMTGDFEVAIAEGATLVRIGTAIFGARR